MQSATAFALITAAAAAAAPVNLTVDFGGPVLRSDWEGLHVVRHGFDYAIEETSHGWGDAARELDYGRLAAARVAGCRTWYAPEYGMPAGWGTPLNFSNPKFEGLARWAGDMQARNISVTLNAGWWFPQHVCNAGFFTNATYNCTPTPADVDIYTAWISATVRELVLTRGLANVDTLLLFTEPLSYLSGHVPAGYTLQGFYFAVARALHERMLADGTRRLVRFLGPNDSGLDWPDAPAPYNALQALNATVAALGDVIDAFSSHAYTGSQRAYGAWLAQFAAATALTPPARPFVVDEGVVGGDGSEAWRNASSYGTQLALWLAAAANAGVSATHLWEWVDQHYVWPVDGNDGHDSFQHGLQRTGLAYWLPANASVRPGYYAYTILSRFLRPAQGAARAATLPVRGTAPGGVVGFAVAGSPALGRLDYRALLLVNENNATAADVCVSMLAGAAAAAADLPPTAQQQPAAAAVVPLQRYLFDPAAVPDDDALVGPSGSFPGAPGQPLCDTLPPGAVLVWAARWEA